MSSGPDSLLRDEIDRGRIAEDAATWPAFQAEMTRILHRLDPDTTLDPLFHISDEEGPNAFVLKGKGGRHHIVLSKGLLKFVENEDQLAYVIGHEASHPDFKKQFGVEYNDRTQENAVDLRSLDLLVQAGYQAEQVPAIMQKFHLNDKKYSPSSTGNHLTDPHSPWSTRYELAQGRLSTEWIQSGKYTTTPSTTPLPSAALSHAEAAKYESSWDIAKRENGYDALPVEGKLAFLADRVDHPNKFLAAQALKEMSRLKLDSQNPFHVAAIDELVDRSFKRADLASDPYKISRIYEASLKALGLEGGAPLGPMKKVQRALTAFAAASSQEEIQSAAQGLLNQYGDFARFFRPPPPEDRFGSMSWEEKPPILTPYQVGFKAFPELQALTKVPSTPALSDFFALEKGDTAGIRDYFKTFRLNSNSTALLGETAPSQTPTPWEKHLEVFRATADQTEAHSSIYNAAVLAGIGNDRRFYEYSKDIKYSSYPPIVQRSDSYTLTKLRPPQPEFPELYAQDLTIGAFAQKREALRRVVSPDRIQNFDDLKNYLTANTSRFEYSADRRNGVSSNVIAAHQDLLKITDRIRENYAAASKEKEFQEDFLKTLTVHQFYIRENVDRGRSRFGLFLEMPDKRPDAPINRDAVERLYVDYVMGINPPNDYFSPDARYRFLYEYDRHPAARLGEERDLLGRLNLSLPGNFLERIGKDIPLKRMNPYAAIKPALNPEQEETISFLHRLGGNSIAKSAAGKLIEESICGPTPQKISSPYDPKLEGILKLNAAYFDSMVSPQVLKEVERQLARHEATATAIPEEVLAYPPQRILDHIRLLDNSGLLADKPGLQKQMRELAITAISQQSSFEVRHELFREMTHEGSISDPALKKTLLEGWAANIKGHVGIDNEPGFQEKITPYLEEVKKTSPFSRYQLLEKLADEVEAQEEASQAIKTSLKPEAKDIHGLGVLITGADELIEQCDRDSGLRRATLEFLTNQYSRENGEEFSRIIAAKGRGVLLGKPVDASGSSSTEDTRVELGHLTAATLHKQFWSLPIAARAAMLSNIIVGPPTKIEPEKSERAFAVATEEVLGKSFPGRDTESLASRDMVKAFMKTCRSDTERGIVLGGLMAGQQQGNTKGNPGEALARVFADMGPAYVKLGQAIESHPDVSPEFKKPFANLKANADLPPRWTLWERIDEVVPSDIRQRMTHLGKPLGSASLNIALDATFDNADGSLGQDAGSNWVLHVQRERARERADVGFDQMRRTIENVEHPLLKGKQGIMLEMVNEGQALTHEELGTAPEKAEQIKNFTDLYANKTVKVGDHAFHFEPVHVPVLGDEFMLQEKAEGVHFKDLPEGPYKAALAEGYYKFEMANIMAGKAFDYDRHGMQCKVDTATNTVHLFDPGGMARTQPGEADIDQLGRFFGRLARAGVVEEVKSKALLFFGHGKDLALETLNESIEKEKKAGNAPDYLKRVRKAALNLGDFYSEIPEGRKAALGREILFGAGVHPKIARKIDQGSFYLKKLGLVGEETVEVGLKGVHHAGVHHGRIFSAPLIVPARQRPAATHATAKNMGSPALKRSPASSSSLTPPPQSIQTVASF